MDGFAGPLSEGRALLTLTVLIGVVLAGVGSYIVRLVGIPVPDRAVLGAVGVVAGLLLVFVGGVTRATREPSSETIPLGSTPP